MHKYLSEEMKIVYIRYMFLEGKYKSEEVFTFGHDTKYCWMVRGYLDRTDRKQVSKWPQ